MESSTNSESSSLIEEADRVSSQDFDIPRPGEPGVRAESFSRGAGAADACIGGLHEQADDQHTFQSRRLLDTEGKFTDLMAGAAKDTEFFIRQYPWQTLLIGFAMGYLLSRSREK